MSEETKLTDPVSDAIIEVFGPDFCHSQPEQFEALTLKFLELSQDAFSRGFDRSKEYLAELVKDDVLEDLRKAKVAQAELGAYDVERQKRLWAFLDRVEEAERSLRCILNIDGFGDQEAKRIKAERAERMRQRKALKAADGNA